MNKLALALIGLLLSTQAMAGEAVNCELTVSRLVNDPQVATQLIKARLGAGRATDGSYLEKYLLKNGEILLIAAKNVKGVFSSSITLLNRTGVEARVIGKSEPKEKELNDRGSARINLSLENLDVETEVLRTGKTATALMQEKVITEGTISNISGWCVLEGN